MRATTLNLFDAAFLAQTQATINPESFGPVTRWWDANSFGLTDGAILHPNIPWVDQTDSHWEASSTTGHEPVLKTNIINGNDVVRMVGTKHFLFEGALDLTLADFTVLAVVLTANDSIILSRDQANIQLRTNHSNLPKSSWFAFSGAEVISNAFNSNNTIARMVGYRRTLEPSGLTSEFVFFDNSGLVNPENGPTGHRRDTFPINQIGVIDGGPLNIDIAELVIYDRSLSTSNIQTLYHKYFKPKFALP